ncbi:MAG: PEGA domain-containing protein, partial [Deltaproteobacteria bacterium]|nr:PEGA domain-containing protein [Deltaproteobacteria bacterium]
LGPFKAISSQDIRQMLAMEAAKQAVGCDDVVCLAEIGGALGADYMISGSVLLTAEVFLIQLQLMNIKQARVEQRVAREYRGGPIGLFDEMRAASKLLVRDLLATRSGRLVVHVAEEGATLRLDGVAVGSSPMQPLTIGAGLHALTVEKDGFIRFARDVEVLQSDETVLTVVLRPSDDYRRKYQDGARTTRMLAWTGLGLGAAGLAGGAALWVVADGKAGELRSDIEAYGAQPIRTSSEADALERRRTDIGRLNTYTIVSAGVGVAALGVGLLLLVTGDDPDRYHAELRVGAGDGGMSLTGTPGGLQATLRF